MSSSVACQRGWCAVFAACAATILTSPAFAGVSYDSGASSVKITHYAERDNAGAFGSKTVSPPPASGSMPIPGSYAYSKTLLLGSGSSSASAGVGAITNSQNVGWTFEGGTGITQTDPTNSFSKAAQLKFVFDGQWDVTSGGFGPTAYGYLSLTVGGSVTGDDSASIDVNLSWKDGSNNNLRAPLQTTVAFPPTSLPYSLTNSLKLNTGSVTSGVVNVTGTITFNALDPGAAVDLHPIDFEFSAAPPTFNFKDASGAFSDPNNWAIDQNMASDFPGQSFPDFAGARAYFGPSGNSSATNVSLQDVPTTLGSVDINRGGLNLDGTAPLTFDTQANNAVLFARNTNNFTGQITNSDGTVRNFTSLPNTISSPVTLNKTLEAIIDTEAPMFLTGQISGAGGIIKSGLGELILANTNSFAGGITVNSGILTAASDGALGSNTVNVNGGALNLATPQPFLNTGTVAVHANGLVNLGNTPVSGVQYHVDAFGAISGPGPQLQNLVVGSNYFPAPNSLIAHQTFDATSGVGNPILANSGSLIFGIAGQGTNFIGSTQSLTIGDASGTPWGGLGGDLYSHTFGGPAGQILQVSGNAQLVSLGGQLSIKAPISDPPPLPHLFKNGAGLVSIDGIGNTFSGPMEVQTGPLAMNADWAGPITVDAGASLGGTGNINSPITFIDSPTTPSVFTPGMMGPVANGPASGNNQTINGPGTLHSGNATFAAHTHLTYDLSTANTIGGADNDLLAINGNLTLAGILDVNAGDNFGPGTYTLMTYTGTLSPAGPQYPTGYLQLGVFDSDLFPGATVLNIPSAAGGGSIVLSVPFEVVPEPAGATLLLLATIPLTRRKRRR